MMSRFIRAIETERAFLPTRGRRLPSNNGAWTPAQQAAQERSKPHKGSTSNIFHCHFSHDVSVSRVLALATILAWVFSIPRLKRTRLSSGESYFPIFSSTLLLGGVDYALRGPPDPVSWMGDPPRDYSL